GLPGRLPVLPGRLCRRHPRLEGEGEGPRRGRQGIHLRGRRSAGRGRAARDGPPRRQGVRGPPLAAEALAAAQAPGEAAQAGRQRLSMRVVFAGTPEFSVPCLEACRGSGAAPIQRAILAGDAETGVGLMQMEAGLDTGPVLLERRTPISRDDTGGSLHDRLAALGAEALAEGLRRVLAGETLAATPQAAEGVVYAHKLDKAESALDFDRPALELERQVRAFDPWPGSDAGIAGEALRIWAAHALDHAHDAAPGSVLGAGREGIDIACGNGVLRITTVQRAGGKRIGAADYLNTRPELRQLGALSPAGYAEKRGPGAPHE